MNYGPATEFASFDDCASREAREKVDISFLKKVDNGNNHLSKDPL